MQKLRFEEFLELKRCVHKEAERMVKEYAEIGEVTTPLKLTREKLMDLHFVVNQVLPSKIGVERLDNGMWRVKIFAVDKEFFNFVKMLDDDLEVISEMCWEEENE